MERLEPIHVMEYRLRRQGVFLLVDFDGKKLWFFGYKKDHAAIKQMMENLKGRHKEMVNFLTARASARGEAV
jgi:hypothetical protein